MVFDSHLLYIDIGEFYIFAKKIFLNLKNKKYPPVKKREINKKKN